MTAQKCSACNGIGLVIENTMHPYGDTYATEALCVPCPVCVKFVMKEMGPAGVKIIPVSEKAHDVCDGIHIKQSSYLVEAYEILDILNNIQ